MTDFSFSLKEKLGGDLVGFNSRRLRLHHLELQFSARESLRTVAAVLA
jgi:hypothetical protein